MILIFLIHFIILIQSQLSYEMIEREKLAFIERSIVQIFQKGSFPEIFQAKTKMLSSCGCEFGTQPIHWGNGVGMMCKLTLPGFTDTCGKRCTTPKGEDILLLCPEDWEFDCGRGCTPPPFNSVRERYTFLEDNVKKILQTGHDYQFLDPDYLATCGCSNNQARLINYGTGVGFDCIIEGEVSEECIGFRECVNDQDKLITIFCPAGHVPTCDGCKATIEDIEDWSSDNHDRYDWSINVLTGYIRESQRFLNLEPYHEQVVHCGCRGPMQPVTYGNRIGFFCIIKDPNDITKECGSGVICKDGSDNELMHFCPDGFMADCEQGCGYW